MVHHLKERLSEREGERERERQIERERERERVVGVGSIIQKQRGGSRIDSYFMLMKKNV